MTQTKYEIKNAEFSNMAHLAARDLIYPKLFGVDKSQIEYDNGTLLNESEKGKILDGEMGVDRIVRVSCKTLSGKITFTVQERFRRPMYSGFKDVTITEWNHTSNTPSELYKINAGIFLYAFFDENTNSFLDGIAFSVTNALVGITKKTLPFSPPRMNKKQQTFIGIKYKALLDAGCALWYQNVDVK